MAQDSSTTKDLSTLVIKKLLNAKRNSSVPNEDILNNFFSILFFTSLKTEEAEFIKVTITLIDPEKPDPSPPERILADRWNYTKFTERIPFTVKNLVKLSKAADVWSSSLAVYYDNTGKLTIWGIIDQAVHYQSFLNYEANAGPEQPGLLQATIVGIGNIIVLLDYELIANLKQNNLISNYVDVLRIGPIKDILKENSLGLKKSISEFIQSNFPEENVISWEHFIDTIVRQTISRLLLKIQNYEHGGAILITKSGGSDLDIKYKIVYKRVSEAIKKIAELTISNTNYSNYIFNEYIEPNKENLPTMLYLNEKVSENDIQETNNELKGAIRFAASLSCIDGLVVLDTNLTVKGFGAVIKIVETPDFVYVSKSSALNKNRLTRINPDSFGTRHRSMFAYCWNNKGSLGFVVSQDGDIRAISRIKDKLVMWENIKVQQYIRSAKLKRSLPNKH